MRVCVLPLTAFIVFVLLSICGQSQEIRHTAALQGFVHDAKGHPIALATVSLESNPELQALTTHTDATGHYQFLSLDSGVYTIHAESTGNGEARFGPCVIEQDNARTVDLTLNQKSASVAGSATSVEFFDEPQFTIAGVTDTTNLGGHGSTTTAGNTDALTKDVRSLDIETQAKSQKGSPQLAEANKTFQTNHENSFETALAHADAGQYELTRTNIRQLLAVKNKTASDKAALYHLLADVEEKSGNSLEAVRDYQQAAELDTSEANLFDWAAELLMHHAAEPASEVFQKGNKRFPRSVRMLVGLGVSLYARGSYDAAVQSLCEASDLNPSDPNPYLYLGKMQNVNGAKLEGPTLENSIEKLARFVQLQPENPLANYYYALGLWNRRKDSEDAEHCAQVDSLLQKALRLDPKLGVAYLQLGIVYADHGDFLRAIAEYQKAIEVSPELEEAHYRLAQAYKRTGESVKTERELQLYKQMSKSAAEQTERKRHEIQQFVYTLRDQTPVSQAH